MSLTVLVSTISVFFFWQFSTAFLAVDGGYTDWTPWGDCSVSCGKGTQTRTRTCTNPPPEGKGSDCKRLGPKSETQDCNKKSCGKLNFGSPRYLDTRPLRFLEARLVPLIPNKVEIFLSVCSLTMRTLNETKPEETKQTKTQKKKPLHDQKY